MNKTQQNNFLIANEAKIPQIEHKNTNHKRKI